MVIMADLDNFFAKKDKKKVKGRKYDNPDEIAKRLKESEKKLEKELCKVEPVKKTLDEVLSTTSKASTGNESVAQEPKIEKQEEEEWKDFTDNSQKDLTNLKISKLQIEDEEDNMLGYGSGDEDGSSGAGNKADGVWNRNIAAMEQENVTIETDPAVPSGKEDSKLQAGGKNYVPPHMRNVQQSSPSHRGNRKPKTAPDITSAMAFPSLSDSQNTNLVGSWGRKKLADERGFEDVKKGSSKIYADNHGPPKLSTANRFDALCDNS